MNKHTIKHFNNSSGGLVRNYGSSRRMLACICAVCMLVMQCFVLVGAGAAPAHAASTPAMLSLIGDASDGSSKSTRVKRTLKITDGAYDGYTIEDILIKNGISDPVDNITSIEIDVPDNELDPVDINSFILSLNEDGTRYGYYVEGEPYENPDNPDEMITPDPVFVPVTKIKFSMTDDYSPVKKITLNKLSNSKLKAGSSKTLKYGSDYTISGDKFFKKDNNYLSFIKWTISGADSSDTSSGKSVKFTMGSAGTTVTLQIKSKDGQIQSSKRTIKSVSKTLTPSPDSITLQIGKKTMTTITVKNDRGVMPGSSLKWSTSNSKVATVTNGMVKAVKPGNATITIKDKESGLSAKVKVKVKKEEKKKNQNNNNRYSNNNSSRYGSSQRPGGTTTYRPSYRPGSSTSTAPRVTSPTTRPSTSSTKPSATSPSEDEDDTDEDEEEDDSDTDIDEPLDDETEETMTGTEVALNPTGAAGTEDELDSEEDGDDEWEEDDGDDSSDGESAADIGFGTAAGSAAVAAAVCGAGAVGRVRRFHIDMGTTGRPGIMGKGPSGSSPGAGTDPGASGKSGIKGKLGKIGSKFSRK